MPYQTHKREYLPYSFHIYHKYHYVSKALDIYPNRNPKDHEKIHVPPLELVPFNQKRDHYHA
jgi:hypothetical protein